MIAVSRPLASRWRVALAALALLGLTCGALAQGEAPPSPPALSPDEAEFRAGWVAFAEPIRKPGSERTAEARQHAREAAIPHLEAAVAAAPRNATYQSSLAYICLTAGKYDKALAAINQAVDLERGDPLLYLLRGQAEAAIAQLNPEEAATRMGPAMTAFSRAAELDPKNALPLLQAASVAVDVNRADLALTNLKKALSLPECRLYRLPVPEDLGSDPASSLNTWEYAQYGHWFGLIARCQNVAGYCRRAGQEAERTGDLAAAEERYQWVRSIAKFVGAAEPPLFITSNTGIELLEDAYADLARVGKATANKEAERWEKELGICQLGREQLFGALKSYERQVSTGAIASVQQSLEAQAKLASPVIAGVGLGTVDQPPPAKKPQ